MLWSEADINLTGFHNVAIFSATFFQTLIKILLGTITDPSLWLGKGSIQKPQRSAGKTEVLASLMQGLAREVSNFKITVNKTQECVMNVQALLNLGHPGEVGSGNGGLSCCL